MFIDQSDRFNPSIMAFSPYVTLCFKLEKKRREKRTNQNIQSRHLELFCELLNKFINVTS